MRTTGKWIKRYYRLTVYFLSYDDGVAVMWKEVLSPTKGQQRDLGEMQHRLQLDFKEFCQKKQVNGWMYGQVDREGE